MKTNQKTTTNQPKNRNSAQPFIEHLYELRRRLWYVALAISGLTALAYSLQRQLIAGLLKPSHGQRFIYTSPIGGVDFLFRVCLYAALIVCIPLIIYHVLRYIEPLISKDSAHFIAIGSLASGVLAAAGVVFGYTIGLPAAMHFLLHQFMTPQIQAMITIQSYLSFVMMYMLGSALLFQIPLILLFINRITPLKPSRLFKAERWVILLAFIVSGLMNPTPNLWSQLIVAGPLILMYQVGIGIIFLTNRSRSEPEVAFAMVTEENSERPSPSPAVTVDEVAAMSPMPAILPSRGKIMDFTPLRRPSTLKKV